MTRVLWIVLPGVAFVALLTIAVFSAEDKPERGRSAPPFNAPLLVGDGTLALEDLRGKPVVLNFWASWCAPCEEEAPLLKDAFEAYGDRVHFVGVNAKDARDDAIAKYEEWDWGFPSVRDVDGSLFSDFGLTGQPESFFLDSDGVVVEHVQGPLFAEDLALLLQRLVSDAG